MANSKTYGSEDTADQSDQSDIYVSCDVILDLRQALNVHFWIKCSLSIIFCQVIPDKLSWGNFQVSEKMGGFIKFR